LFGSLHVDGDVGVDAAGAEGGGKGGDAGGDGKDGQGDAGASPEGVNFADWVPKNFRRAEAKELNAEQLKMLQYVDIEALARSQADLRKQIGAGNFKPPAKPDEYTFDMPEGVKLDIKPDDPLMATLRQGAHSAGITKDQFNKMVAPAVAAIAKAAAEAGVQLTPEQQAQAAEAAQAEQAKSFDAEIQKLGKGGKEIVQQVGGWLKGLEVKGHLTGDEFTALRGLSNADGVNALRKLMNMTGEKPIPVDLGDIATGLSVQDAKDLMTAAHVKLQKDPNDAKGKTDLARAKSALEKYEKAGQLTGPVYG
jgi:hypothetical protein